MSNLLKEYHIADWCKRGAWTIAVMGLLGIVAEIYADIQQSGASGVPVSFTIATVLQGVFSIASPTLFYCLVLYSAGLLIQHIAATQEDASEDVSPEVEQEGEKLVQEQAK